MSHTCFTVKINNEDKPLLAAVKECLLANYPDVEVEYSRFNPDNQIQLIWGTDDVRGIRPNLTEEQAKEVLDYAERRHNANEGINWDILGIHADSLFPIETPIERFEIVFRGKNPLMQKLEIFSIQVVELTSKDGDSYYIDAIWNQTSSNHELKENGEYYIKCECEDLNDDLAEDDYETVNIFSNVNAQMLTPTFITDSKITYIDYEAYLDLSEEKFVELDLVSIEVFDENGKGFKFSQETIDEYNEKQNCMNISADIVLRSIEPLQEEPAIFTVGGYSAVTKDGKPFNFDWDEYYSNHSHDEQGRMIFEATLRGFNDEDFIESNLEEGIKHSQITDDFILSSLLTEVFYECFRTEVEIAGHIPLELVSFTINGKSFSESEIARYNKEEGYEFNNPKKETVK